MQNATSLDDPRELNKNYSQAFKGFSIEFFESISCLIQIPILGFQRSISHMIDILY